VSSPADDVAPAPRSGRWTVRGGVAVVLAVVLAGIVVALLRPGGPVGGDRPEGLEFQEPIDLEGGQTLAQPFTASNDDLSSITMRFGTYGGRTGCAIEVELTERASPDDVIAERVLPCRDIPDSSLFRVFDLPPIADSAGGDYMLRVRPQAGSEDVIAVWGGLVADLPHASRAGRQLDATAEVHLGYGDAPRAYDLLGLAMERMDQYGGSWEDGLPALLLVAVAVGAIAALVVVGRRWVVLTLVVFAVAKGVLWSAVLPSFEGVDEHAHFAYAQFLGTQGRIPSREEPLPGFDIYSDELHGALDEFRYDNVPVGDRPDYGAGVPATKSALEGLDRRANGTGAAAGYAPHYYAVPALAEKLSVPIDVRVSAMRLWSVALGAVAVVLTLLIGRRVFPDHDQAAVLLALGVGLHPMWSQETAIVNNDAGVILAGTWAVLLALDLAAVERPNRWLPFLAGLAGGLALVAKGFGVVVVPLLAVAWVVGRARGQRPVGLLADVVRAAAGFAVGYGTWVVTAAALDLAGVGIQTNDPSPGPRGVRAFLNHLRADWFLGPRRNWIEQYWGAFSWVDTRLPSWAYTTILVAVLLGAALVVVWLVRSAVWALRWLQAWRTGSVRPEPPGGAERQTHAFVLFAAVAGMLATLYGIMFVYFQEVGRLDLIQGRYALLATPAILALPVAVLRVLVPRWSPVPAMTVVASSMGALQVFGVALLIERFYL
jgi:4-amino-4-deoxy-L-arabinose transferase-like glycosyltransferase